MKARTLLYTNAVFITTFAILSTLLTPAVKAAPDTCTWTGKGTDKLASNSANWSGCDNNVPENDDTIELPASAVPDLVNYNPNPILFNNDITLAGIKITGSYTNGNKYALGGSGKLTIGGAIDVSEGYGHAVYNEVSLNKNLTIKSTNSGTLNFGDYDIPSKFSINNFDVNVTGASLSLYTDIYGSGNINSDNRVTLSGNNSSYTGNINAKNLIVYTLNALKGNIQVPKEGIIDINIPGQDTTITTPITINSQGFTSSNDSLIPAIMIYVNDYSGNSLRSNAVTVDFTNITLNNDSNINVQSINKDIVKFSGSGLGEYKISPVDGSQGKISIGGVETRANPKVTPHTDSQPTYPLSINDNHIDIVNGVRGDVTVFEGGILKGTGTVGVIKNNGGKVAPGLSPGVLNSSNVNYTGGTYEVELGGITPGNGDDKHDQLNVTGTVDLGSATALSVVHWNNFRPALNNQFVIINNDGSDAVVGTFQGLAQGATLTVDGITYTISYTGGDGNDVVLTATNVSTTKTPATPNTGIQMIKDYSLITLITSILALASLVYIKKFSASKK